MFGERGMTLMELVVVLAVLSMLLAGLHRILRATSDAMTAVVVTTLSDTREANADHLLTRVLGSADARGIGSTFRGTTHGVSFRTWVDDRHGWATSTLVSVTCGDQDVRLAGLYETPLVLWDTVDACALAYLESPGSPWHATWARASQVPTAVRLLIARAGIVDTHTFVVGPRG